MSKQEDYTDREEWQDNDLLSEYGLMAVCTKEDQKRCGAMHAEILRRMKYPERDPHERWYKEGWKDGYTIGYQEANIEWQVRR